MPSSLPIRPALRAWSGSLPIRTTTTPASSIIARHIHRPSENQRLEGTLPPSPNDVRIPPDSPKYITVPEPPQHSEEKLPTTRGHLPIPRDVFRRRSGGAGEWKGMHAQEYVAQIRPRSKAERRGREPKSDVDAKKRELADLRRENLTLGLEGLWRRRVGYRRAVATRKQAKRDAYLAASSAPEGRDDVLTRGTVTLATINTAVPPDPLRFEKAALAAKRTEAKAAAKSEARRDALSQLYMASGSFIVDEKELEERVESIFTENHHINHSMFATAGATNVWTSSGPPSKLEDLLNIMQGTHDNLLEASKAPVDRATTRQKKVSEELTGGKLDNL